VIVGLRERRRRLGQENDGQSRHRHSHHRNPRWTAARAAR